jgi:hypothetical protein
LEAEEDQMRYVKVYWDHSLANEPMLLFSECSDEGWEIRKIETFRNGRTQSADGTSPDVSSTRLGLAPVPSVAVIAQQFEFRPFEIDKIEFEEAWNKAMKASSAGWFLVRPPLRADS